jgi:putative hydrolase of the HAD superfamily
MLEAVTFDFWGTLYHGAYGMEQRLALIAAALEHDGHSYSRRDLRAAYDDAWSVVDRIWRTEHRSLPVSGWLDVMFARLEADVSTATRCRLQRPVEEVLLVDGAGPELIPGVSAVVPALASRYQLGLISDVGLTPGRVLRQVLSRDGLLQHFDVLTFSDEAGATKPVPEVFLRTLEGLGARPKRAAHIGDLPETDLTGARAAGMWAVLFLGASGREDGLPLADASFRAYSELPELLSELDGVSG